MTEHNGHITEGTDYMVDYLANSEKLKPKEQRWYPSHNQNGGDDDDIDDNFNNYVTHNDIPMNQNTETNYNGGDSYQQQNNTFDERSENNNQTVQGGSGQSSGSINKFIDEEYEMLSEVYKTYTKNNIQNHINNTYYNKNLILLKYEKIIYY